MQQFLSKNYDIEVRRRCKGSTNTRFVCLTLRSNRQQSLPNTGRRDVFRRLDLFSSLTGQRQASTPQCKGSTNTGFVWLWHRQGIGSSHFKILGGWCWALWGRWLKPESFRTWNGQDPDLFSSLTTEASLHPSTFLSPQHYFQFSDNHPVATCIHVSHRFIWHLKIPN